MTYSPHTIERLKMEAWDEFYKATREANRGVELAKVALAVAEREREEISAPARSALRRRLDEIREKYPLGGRKS